MFNSLANRIAQLFVKQGIISEADKELYRFGFNQFLTIIFNVVTTLIIGCAFHMVISSVIFLIVYVPLRSYAGGYHANTPWRCYVLSTLVIALVLIILKYFTNLLVCYAIVLIAGTILCLLLSPVSDQNKPFDDTEQKVFKKVSHMILIIEIILSIIAFFVYLNLFKIISLAVFIEGIMLVLGKLKNFLIVHKK